MNKVGTPQAVQPAIPFKRESAGGDPALATSGVAILIISLIAIIVVLLLRRRLGIGRKTGDRQPLLQVLETQRLGPRALVSVVAFNGTHYLLAQGDHGVTCLAAVAVGTRT